MAYSGQSGKTNYCEVKRAPRRMFQLCCHFAEIRWADANPNRAGNNLMFGYHTQSAASASRFRLKSHLRGHRGVLVLSHSGGNASLELYLRELGICERHLHQLEREQPHEWTERPPSFYTAAAIRATCVSGFKRLCNAWEKQYRNDGRGRRLRHRKRSLLPK